MPFIGHSCDGSSRVWRSDLWLPAAGGMEEGWTTKGPHKEISRLMNPYCILRMARILTLLPDVIACTFLLLQSGSSFELKWQIFSAPFPSAQKTSYYNALFSFCHNNKSFFESITRKLISGVISWSSNFWIYIFLICQPLLARQVAGMLIPGDFTVTLLRLMQVELQITFNRMHLLRSIIESGSQRTGGNFKNN